MRAMVVRAVAVVALVAVAASAASSALLTAPFASKHWRSTGRAPATRRHCMAVAVKHTDAARDTLNRDFAELSDPRHPRYGQYKSLDALSAVMAPPQDRVDAIRNFVVGRADPALPGGAPEVTVHEPNRDWMTVCMSVAQAEHVFATEFHTHEHVDGRTRRAAVRAVKPATIPADVAQHIDFVSGLNTPIHNYAARKATVLDVTRSPAVLKDRSDTAALSAAEQTAPDLTHLYGGNDLLNVGLRVYCANGQLNNDTAPNTAPCTYWGNAVTGFTLLITPTTASYPPRTVSIPLAQVTRGTDGVRAGAAYASFLVEIRKYIGHTVSVATVFATGPASPFCTANTSPVYSTDYVTPAFLKALYGIPSGIQVNPRSGSTQSVAEFLGQYFNPADLTAYLRAMGVPDQTVTTVLGPNNATEGSISGGEAQLDIQVIMGVAVNAPTWFWSLPGDPNAPEPFDAWLAQVASTANAPLVHSVSYADAEHSMNPDYTDRLNSEFQKAGVRGLTLLFASGDDGVASYEGRNDTSVCATSRPEFPSASPYVTSVGGTQLSLNSAPACTNTVVRGVPVGCSNVVETVCSGALGGVITSGGGFSDRYPRPSYQDAAVTAYLNGPTPLPPAGFYNPSGRGYPDVAGMAAAYLVQMGDKLVPESGTSASTPLWAAMVTLWNDIRLSTGQPPLGFLNPLLYGIHAAHPDVFNDVVTGENNCLVDGLPCCAHGFKAAPAWDPTTGLGSPRFVELANLMINPNLAFAFVPPQQQANGQSDSDYLPRVSIILSITALVAATVAFAGFLVSLVCNKKQRQEGLLDTRS